jgi:hypothetical protein
VTRSERLPPIGPDAARSPMAFSTVPMALDDLLHALE